MARLPWLALVLTACSPWTVLRQSATLTHATPLAVTLPTFHLLRVGKLSEPDYVAKKTPEEKQAFQAEKNLFATSFAKTVVEKRAALDIASVDEPDRRAGRFLIKSNVQRLELGSFEGLYNTQTEVRTHVAITDPDETALDELEVRCVVPATLLMRTVDERLAECGRITAQRVDAYLQTRALR